MYSFRVQFGINCTLLVQSETSDFVECTIKYLIDVKFTVDTRTAMFGTLITVRLIEGDHMTPI